MVKDSKRFADIGGWGYGLFLYDDKTDAFKPEGHRRELRNRVPHDREVEGLCVHEVREEVARFSPTLCGTATPRPAQHAPPTGSCCAGAW